jgi:glycosyltransferase involved in cell wall biosynthesis
VKQLLNSADLIYASTGRLKERLQGYFPRQPIYAGEIYCSSPVLRAPNRSRARKLGYMASADHAHNLEMVLPAIERLLECNPDVRFETFGSIPLADRLKRFGDRVGSIPPVVNYDQFLNEFAEAGWDIGICPLVPIDFNLMKANTKWVEYTAAGAAVVASRGPVYDQCCDGGCGILADGVDEWFTALDLLVNNVEERVATVERAQARLAREYNMASLREQVLGVLAQARSTRRRANDRESKEVRVCQLR